MSNTPEGPPDQQDTGETFRKPMVFIVGVGRSGTSLLQSMLHAHPKVSFTPETSFVRRYLATGRLHRVFQESGPQAVIDLLMSDDKIQRLKFEGSDWREILTAQPEDFSAGRFYLDMLNRHAAHKNGCTMLGDKDPRCIEFLPTLHKHFPDLYLLHIYRDPRDVLSSKQNAEWSNRRPLPLQLFANRVQFSLGSKLGPRFFGERYLEFAYETLLREPETTLKRICGHLKLDYHPGMLNFANAGKALVSQDEMQWKKETLGPLLAQNSGKWRDQLSPLEVALTQTVCRPAMNRGSYQVEPAKPTTRAWLPFAGLAFAALSTVYGVYRTWRQS